MLVAAWTKYLNTEIDVPDLGSVSGDIITHVSDLTTGLRDGAERIPDVPEVEPMNMIVSCRLLADEFCKGFCGLRDLLDQKTSGKSEELRLNRPPQFQSHITPPSTGSGISPG